MFNYSFISFINDNNLSNELRITIYSMLKSSLISKSIPKDILQQLLDLVEFLEHNGENIIALLNEVKLGDISE